MKWDLKSIGSFSVFIQKRNWFCAYLLPQYGLAEKAGALKQPKKFIPHCFIEEYKLDG